MRSIKYTVLHVTCLMTSACAGQLLNLEQNAQPFVVETKQINIPGFPCAFNASIVRWHDKLLMCFRVRDKNMISTFQIGCVWLDDAFNVISEPYILEIKNDSST